MTLREAAVDRNNNLNIIRLIASLMVVYMHSLAVSLGDQSVDIFYTLTNHKDLAGGIAVYIFFIISGFLICRSYDRSKSLGSYAKARFLRIWPLLFVVVIVSAFVIGPIASDYSAKDYYTHPLGYLPFLRNLVFDSSVTSLPGVFSNQYNHSVNGSLWTLMYEVIWYILVVLLSPLWKKKRITGPILYTLLAVLYLCNMLFNIDGTLYFSAEIISNFSKLGMFFSMGMCYYLYEDEIVLNIKYFAIAIVGLFAGILFANFIVTFSIFGAYIIFYLAFQKKYVATWYDKVGDLSYGIYIMAFPIQQVIVAILGDESNWTTKSMNPYLNLVLTLIIIIPLSWLSWHYIEQPCLRLKNRT